MKKIRFSFKTIYFSFLHENKIGSRFYVIPVIPYFVGNFQSVGPFQNNTPCLLAARCYFATITLEIEYFGSKIRQKKTTLALNLVAYWNCAEMDYEAEAKIGWLL